MTFLQKTIFVLIILLIPIAFLLGGFLGNLKYAAPLAHCNPASVPYENAETQEVSLPMSTMFRNYYGHTYNFSGHIVPKGVSLKDYYSTFNSGGFHYLKTTNGEVVACGFYK
ncbi:MAG: hypothetical protein WC052_04025 [Patescibacteria group bacterium]|jgi:hypothetical protein